MDDKCKDCDNLDTNSCGFVCQCLSGCVNDSMDYSEDYYKELCQQIDYWCKRDCAHCGNWQCPYFKKQKFR